MPPSQASELDADSITAIWCQVAGSAWQKVCTPRPGLARASGVTTNSTPEVPSETKPSPGRVTPTPTAPPALSPAPAATRTVAGRPQAAVQSGSNWPMASLPSCNSGMWRRPRPVAASMASLQRRAATSSHSVPAASLQSLLITPASCSSSQSLGSSTLATRAKTCGSCPATHSSLGAVKPAMARLAVMRRVAGSRRSISSHSAWLRPSFQRMAGRSTSALASSSTAPCIWPATPSAATRPQAALPAASRSARTARSTACSQSAGCCSDHSGCGLCTCSGATASASSCPPADSSTAFTPEVPRSRPMARLALCALMAVRSAPAPGWASCR